MPLVAVTRLHANAVVICDGPDEPQSATLEQRPHSVASICGGNTTLGCGLLGHIAERGVSIEQRSRRLTPVGCCSRRLSAARRKHYGRFGDPGFAYSPVLAKIVGRVVLRMADTEIPLQRYGDFAETVSHYLDQVKKLADTKREAAETQEMSRALLNFAKRALP
jgi:hypothetical protein